MSYWPELELGDVDEIHGMTRFTLRGDDPVEKWQAIVKDDGCVDFQTKDDDGEYCFAFHICDMTRFMERMEELTIKSQLAFGPHWGGRKVYVGETS